MRVVNKSKETYDVYIGRGSKWGNPFRIGVDGNRAQVIRLYHDYILKQPHLMKALPELKGKVLGCYCAPKPCHGDILMQLVSELT
jgi:hypothetical protein